MSRTISEVVRECSDKKELEVFLAALPKETNIAALINEQHSEDNKTAMHHACTRGDPDILRILLSFNPNLAIKDKAAHTAEHYLPKEGAKVFELAALFETYRFWLKEAEAFDIDLNQLLYTGRRILTEMPVGVVAAKPAVVVMGKTKSGKSKLINFLLGVPYVHDDKGDLSPTVDEYASVGHKFLSNTLYPSHYEVADKPYVLIDMAGFGDNRDAGKLYEIISALLVRLMVKKVRQISSLAVVLSWLSVKDKNLNDLLLPIEQLASILQKDEKLIGNVVFCLSKTDELRVAPSDATITGKMRELFEAYKTRPDANVVKDRLIRKIFEALIDKTIPIVTTDLTKEATRARLLSTLDKVKQPVPVKVFDFEDFNKELARLSKLHGNLKAERDRIHQQYIFLQAKRRDETEKAITEVIESLPSSEKYNYAPPFAALSDAQDRLLESLASFLTDIKLSLAATSTSTSTSKPEAGIEISETVTLEELQAKLHEYDLSLKVLEDFVGIGSTESIDASATAAGLFASGAAGGAGAGANESAHKTASEYVPGL